MKNRRGNFCVSTRMHYGVGSIDYLSTLNIGKVLIVADPFMIKSKMIDYVTERIEKADIDYVVFDEVIPDPTISVIVKGVKFAEDSNPEAIIALGGGSAIDTAKGILYFYTTIQEVRGKGEKPTLIAIPTTSGTGSEVTDFSIITDEKVGVKVPLIDKRLMPNHAILDASLVRSVPPSVTADTGLDVLTHALEAYVSTKASDFTDALAEKAIKVVFKYLTKAFNDGDDDEARMRLHNASAMAGMAFTHTSLGINHSMAHAIGGKFHVPHGRANGILLTFVIDYNSEIEDVATRYAEISKLLGLNYMSDIYAAKDLINLIKKLQHDLDMPTCFKETGIVEDEFLANLEELVHGAMKDPCTKTNPRVPNPDEIRALFIKAYYGR